MKLNSFWNPVPAAAPPNHEDRIQALEYLCRKDNIDIEKLLELCKIKKLSELSLKKYESIMSHWDKVIETCSTKNDFF